MARQFIYPVDMKKDGTAIAGQLVFQPTRSIIHKGATLAPSPKALVDPVHQEPFLITIPDPAEEWFADEPEEPACLELTYDGEPLRPVGFIWPASDEELQEQDCLIEDWIECRKRQACGSPARQYFLDLDLWSMPVLMISSTQDQRDEREKVVENVGFPLRERILFRAKGYSIQNAVLRTPSSYLEIERKMRELLEHHFGGDREQETEACEQFAAGQLKQTCPPAHPELKGFTAGDPDSANVFLFAEMALAMVELGDRGILRVELANYWRQRVNMFARMQAIFLERWEAEGQRRFERYDGESPPLASIPGEIITPYERAGDDPCALVRLIEDQIRRMTWD